ncbi:MAG: GTPase [Acidilobaceae archaeon]
MSIELNVSPPEAVKEVEVPLYEELLKRVTSRAFRKRKNKEGCLSGLETTFNILYSNTNDIETFYKVFKNLHPFYSDLLSIEFDLEEANRAFSCVFKARKLSKRFWEVYRYRALAAETTREACRETREGIGRTLSLFKRCKKALLLLKNLVVYLSGLPSIDVSSPLVIVAGAPNVGKSTFVRAVSTGKPEIANYPFTTKNVTLGHRVVEGFKVQFIDTPGLLDRPIEQMNKIEKKAIAALSKLMGGVLFLLDPTPNAHLSISAQKSLLENMKKIIGEKPLFIAINKLDEADPELLKEARKIADEFTKLGFAIKKYELIAVDKISAEVVANDVGLLTLKHFGFLS